MLAVVQLADTAVRYLQRLLLLITISWNVCKSSIWTFRLPCKPVYFCLCFVYLHRLYSLFMYVNTVCSRWTRNVVREKTQFCLVTFRRLYPLSPWYPPRRTSHASFQIFNFEYQHVGEYAYVMFIWLSVK